MPESQTEVRTEVLAIGRAQRLGLLLVIALSLAISIPLLLTARAALMRTAGFPF